MARGRTLRRRRRRLLGASVAELLRWAAGRGFRNATRLAPRIFPDTGRGLLCRQAVPPGGILLRLPRPLLVSGQVALQALSSCSLCSRQGLSVASSGGPERLLTLFLVHERLLGPSSAWAPYVASLPTSFDLLSSWGAQEVEVAPWDLRAAHKEAARALQAALEAEAPLLDVMARAHGAVDPRGLFPWAHAAVNSRCVYCRLPCCPPELAGPVLAPFLDLLNHEPRAQVEASFKEGHLELRALKGVRKNTQALISYGPHDSAALLTEYGFLMPNNHHDAVPISVGHLQFCFGLEEAALRSKARALQLKIDADGICRPLCLLPHGPTFCLLQLLQKVLRGPDGPQEEEEMLRDLKRPLIVLSDQLQEELQSNLKEIRAATRCYRQNCLQRLLQGREAILTACRRVIETS